MRSLGQLGILVASLAASAAGVEAGARMFLPETPMFQLAFVRGGWRAEPNTRSIRIVEDPRSHRREVTVETFEHGFKRWGDVHAQKRRMLVLGDSFTYAAQVGNGEEYYAQLERAFPDWEVFVYGATGYGSLQEYLVLDEFVDVIRPDVIVWQWCDNDWSNNVFASSANVYGSDMTWLSYLEVNRKRPYLEDDHIVYRLVRPYAWWREHLKVVDFLLDRWDGYRAARWERDSRFRQAFRRRNPKMASADRVRAAIPVTTRIFAMARERSGRVPFYLFSTNTLEAPLVEICRSTGITCIPGVTDLLRERMREGIQIYAADGIHWGLAGHESVGKLLVAFLRRAPAFAAADH